MRCRKVGEFVGEECRERCDVFRFEKGEGVCVKNGEGDREV